MSKSEIILKLSEEPRPKEILLKLELKNIDLPVQYQITRDNNLILSGQLVTNDSIFKDSGLAPSTQYTYQAFISQNGSIVSASNILKANTMDTTSHNYVWTIDTIGSFGSSLFDVFAISENDVWAVGEIDTGVYPPFNAVHWDGQQWELKRIYFYLCPNENSPTSYPIQAIFAFSENSIWFTRGASFVHWDGNEFIHDCSMNSMIDGSIQKMWGKGPQDLYAVGYYGTIIHYNGSNWDKLESGTQLRLTDIWGLSGNDIYAVGADMSSLDNAVLHYDGISWKQLPTDQNRKVAVWGTSPSNMYFAGDGVYHYNDGNYKSIHWPVTFLKIFSDAIRGTAPR